MLSAHHHSGAKAVLVFTFCLMIIPSAMVPKSVRITSIEIWVKSSEQMRGRVFALSATLFRRTSLHSV